IQNRCLEHPYCMPDDKKALVERLILEHGNALLRYVRRCVRKPADAADLAQEVFLRMLRVPDIEGIRDPQAYLYTVAHNVIRERVLQDRRTGNAVDVDDPSVQALLGEPPVVELAIDRERSAKKLHQIMMELPPAHRASLLLQARGMTYE